VDSGISLSLGAFSDEYRLFSLGYVPDHNAIILTSSTLVGGAVHAGNAWIAKCFGGGILVEVQKPQSRARAENSYADAQTTAAFLSNFGIPQDAVEYFLKLLPTSK
jgi:hypothetical protein